MCGGKWIPEIDSAIKNEKNWAKNRARCYFDCVKMPPRSLQTQNFFEKKWLFEKNIAESKG